LVTETAERERGNERTASRQKNRPPGLVVLGRLERAAPAVRDSLEPAPGTPRAPSWW